MGGLDSHWQQKIPLGEETTPPSPPMELPLPLWQILYHRGISNETLVDEHFAAKLSQLTDPMKLDGMERAVERLLRAYKSNEKICVYGDFDLDGTSGVALLVDGLNQLGFNNIVYYQPKRLSEGYGLHSHAVEKLAEDGVSLILTVDVGITAIRPVARANELGVDVIITDHHLPKEELPEAVAVVNPNKGHCSSGLGHLCGAGVAFFVLLALRRYLNEKGVLRGQLDPKSLLDCFAIATLTDLVPLVRENRALVKHGLVALQKTQRPGLRSLLKRLGMGGRVLTGQDVAIRFAPKLNALSRMEMDILPLDLYMVSDPERAEELAKEALERNDQRLSLQKSAEQEAIKWIAANPQNGFVWVISDKFHQGVVGLVATKMSQRYNVPSYVGAISEDGTVTVSARSPKDYPVNVLEALESAPEGLIPKFGGHAQAAGFEMEAERFDELAQHFNKHFNGFAESAREKVIWYDAELDLHQIDSHFMKWYESMGPFGTEFEVPNFLIRQVDVTACKELRGGHLKLSLKNLLQTRPIDALWFSPPADHPVVTKVIEGLETVDIIAEPQWNYFAGRQSIQLLVNHIRLC